MAFISGKSIGNALPFIDRKKQPLRRSSNVTGRPARGLSRGYLTDMPR